MARVTNGFLGNFTTTEELTAKFPPSEHAGCSANIGSAAPYSKAWSDGSTWNALASAPIQALVSGARNVTPVNYGPRMRYGNAVASAANSVSTRMNGQAWQFPFDVYGFQFGWESNETGALTIVPAKWAICGAAGDSWVTALADVGANWHNKSISTLTFAGSGTGTIAARSAADVPGAVLWSDMAYGKVSAGQALCVRYLQTTASAYPVASTGVPRDTVNAAVPVFPVAAWTLDADRVTTPTAWGTDSNNYNSNLPIQYINLLTDAPVKSVAVIGDSTTTGTVNTAAGTESFPPLQRACELLGASLGFRLVPYQRGWSGKEASQFYTYALSTIAATYPPDALIYQVWSQNDTAATSNDAELALAMDVVSRCRRAGITPILMTGIPVNGDTLADDNERKRLNNIIRTWNVPLIDADLVISDGGSPAAYQSAYGAAVHPNYAGYTALAAEYARVLALALA